MNQNSPTLRQAKAWLQEMQNFAQAVKKSDEKLEAIFARMAKIDGENKAVQKKLDEEAEAGWAELEQTIFDWAETLSR